MPERIISPNQPSLDGVDYSAAVTLTRGIAENIRRHRRSLASPYGIETLTQGCDDAGTHDLVVQWGDRINGLKLGLSQSGNTSALERLRGKEDVVYVSYTWQVATGGFASLGLLVDENGEVMNEEGLPVDERKLQPLYAHQQTFETIARRSLKEAITRVQSRAEIRSAGKQPMFGAPTCIEVAPSSFMETLDTPHKAPRKYLTDTIAKHNLLPTWQMQIYRDGYVKFSEPFELSHEKGARPAYVTYGTSRSIDQHYPGLVYMDPNGAWRQVVELRTGQSGNWFKLNNQFEGTTLPYQLQEQLSRIHARNTQAQVLDIYDSLKLLQGAIKQRPYGANDSWDATSRYLEQATATIDDHLNGVTSPNFLTTPVAHYPLVLPDTPFRNVECEVVPSFDGSLFYTFALTQDADVSWLVAIDSPNGMVRLPAGNRTTAVRLDDQSGSLTILDDTPAQSYTHPLHIKYREIRSEQRERARYAKHNPKRHK